MSKIMFAPFFAEQQQNYCSTTTTIIHFVDHQQPNNQPTLCIHRIVNTRIIILSSACSSPWYSVWLIDGDENQQCQWHQKEEIQMRS